MSLGLGGVLSSLCQTCSSTLIIQTLKRPASLRKTPERFRTATFDGRWNGRSWNPPPPPVQKKPHLSQPRSHRLQFNETQCETSVPLYFSFKMTFHLRLNIILSYHIWVMNSFNLDLFLLIICRRLWMVCGCTACSRPCHQEVFKTSLIASSITSWHLRGQRLTRRLGIKSLNKTFISHGLQAAKQQPAAAFTGVLRLRRVINRSGDVTCEGCRRFLHAVPVLRYMS